jgi:hypothetical protein
MMSFRNLSERSESVSLSNLTIMRIAGFMYDMTRWMDILLLDDMKDMEME